MELDSFLASPRWDILKIVINKPSSPMEIAQQLGITTSFASQQLKLLEAKDIVKKEKTGAFEKGKPRSLFSISKESLYIVPLAKNAPEKSLVPLSKKNKAILNIWALKDKRLHTPLQKFFWQIEPHLPLIKKIFVYTKSLVPKIYIVSKDNSLTHQINETQKNMEEQMPFQVVSSSPSLKKLDQEYLYSIYVTGNYDKRREYERRSK